MKYTASTLLFLGLISYAEATTSLTQTSSTLKSTVIVDQDEESDDDTLVMWTDDFGGEVDGIVDALTTPEGTCQDRLWMNQAELDWQIDAFSRRCDMKNW